MYKDGSTIKYILTLFLHKNTKTAVITIQRFFVVETKELYQDG